MTDYGINKQITTSQICKTNVGTGNTQATEVFEGRDYGNKCDLWSIGVIIYQLAFNEYPYKGNIDNAIYNNIKKLGQRLLVYDIEKRINWDEHFRHPFF